MSRPQSPRPMIADNTPQRQRPPPLPLDEGGSTNGGGAGGSGHDHVHELDVDVEYEDEPTPQIRRSRPASLLLHELNPGYELSPWADAQSQSHTQSRSTMGMSVFAGTAV
jgi:hypothetical protein